MKSQLPPPVCHANEERVRAAWARADAQAVSDMQQAGFISHNVPLSATECTRPGQPLIGESPRTVAIHDLLRRLVPQPLAGRRAVDLGCLEGGLSFELWRAGLQVLGVEVREDNLARCRRLQAYYGAGGEMEFLQADVREFRPARPYDVVVCSGLLYHLDDPAAYLHALGELTAPGGLLFLDTHVAPEDVDLPACEYRPWLSPLMSREQDGLTLRWREYAEDVTKAESSIGNAVSLWLDADSHVELLLRAGFARVFEPAGYYGPGETALKRRYARRYWAALKQT
jgi:2-polyprenyl-3-methyl-5-hydroxy-6-metoxy-1,4-benzoquinol methylase